MQTDRRKRPRGRRARTQTPDGRRRGQASGRIGAGVKVSVVATTTRPRNPQKAAFKNHLSEVSSSLSIRGARWHLDTRVAWTPVHRMSFSSRPSVLVSFLRDRAKKKAKLCSFAPARVNGQRSPSPWPPPRAREGTPQLSAEDGALGNLDSGKARLAEETSTLERPGWEICTLEFRGKT